jgi:hypothetical protein
MSDYETIIKNWFRRELGGSLILPSGWFGRPYGNQHMLTKLTQENDVVEVVLDDHLSLKFFDLRSVPDGGASLVFSQFSKLIFVWI